MRVRWRSVVCRLLSGPRIFGNGPVASSAYPSPMAISKTRVTHNFYEGNFYYGILVMKIQSRDWSSLALAQSAAAAVPSPKDVAASLHRHSSRLNPRPSRQ